MKRYTPLLSIFIATSQCSSTIVIPCLSAISLDLGASMAQTQYVIINFILGASLSQLVLGPVADYIGRKKIAVLCLYSFMASSFASIWENSMVGLCWLRFIQGFSIGSASILCRAILRDRYQDHEFLKNNAVLSATIAITPIFSPLLGLCLLELFTWRATFLFLAILSLSVAFLWSVHFKETLVKKSTFTLNLLRRYLLILRTPTFLTNALCGGLIYSAEVLIISRCSLSFGFKGLILMLSCSYALGCFIAVKLTQKMSFFHVVKFGLLLTVSATSLSILFCHEGIAKEEMFILPFSMFMFGASFIYANTAALALLPFSETAGVASCLLSVVQNGLASLISIVMGVQTDDMLGASLTLLSLCVLACLVFFFSKDAHSSILEEGNW